MASNAKCIFFLLLALCFSFQTHARDSKFFSKVSKTTKENHESISVSPTQAPTLSPSPSPEPEVIEHGYGLYGQDPYQNYEYPPTTKNPTKVGDEEKFVSGEEMSKNNFNEFGNNEKQGMSDTRFLENGKYYYDPNQDVKDESSYFQKSGNGNGNGNGNGYEREMERERQGMSDTRFLENGKYYHDINEEEKNNGHFNFNNNENENFEEDEEENNAHFNTNNYENENENFEDEKNGKYYYGHNNGRMPTKEGKNGRFEIDNNGNGNGNENFEAEKHGMSDTRFLENGKYYFDVENEKYSNNHNFNNFNNFNNNNKFGVEDVGFHSNNNVEYANSYKGNGNENNGYETEGRGGYNYNRNEYGYNGVKPKKFSNVYDSMEEYDREQGYIDGQDKYVP